MAATRGAGAPLAKPPSNVDGAHPAATAAAGTQAASRRRQRVRGEAL